MTSRCRWIARAGVLGALLVASAGVHAQNRFEPLTRDVVAVVPGLEIVTLRDNALSACYTLFIVRSPAAALVASLVEPTSVDAAAAERDRRLNELGAEFGRDSVSLVPGVAANPLQFQFEGQKVQGDFEQVVREALFAKLDARLTQIAQIAATPRLAVIGPAPCAATIPAAKKREPEGR